jgi:hypothetical protein
VDLTQRVPFTVAGRAGTASESRPRPAPRP